MENPEGLRVSPELPWNVQAWPHPVVANGKLYIRDQDVLLCYDPHDLDQAVIADLDGRMIAQVKAEVLQPHSAEAIPAIAASMQERRRLRNATVATVRQIEQFVTEFVTKFVTTL